LRGNPFFGNKFLLHGTEYIEKLLDGGWLDLPPICAEIDPTNICNHKCLWCMFDEFRYRKPDSISPTDMERVIGELGKTGVKAITFTGGGEPLCNREVFPRNFYNVTENGMELGLVTNGSLLNKYSKAICDNCTFVRVSLDAATAETHLKLHRTKDFDTIIENVKELVRYGNVDVGLAFLVHPENYLEIKDFCELSYQLGVDYVQIRPVWMQGLSLSKKTVESVTQNLEEVSSVIDDPKFQIFTRMDRFMEILNRDKGFTECLATPLVAVIGSDLNVYLCCQFRGFSNRSFGNLKKASFKAVWKGDRRLEIIREIDVNKCPPCRYRTYNITLSQLKGADHRNFL